jgi:hypothetical protein
MAGIIVHQDTSAWPAPPSRDITIRDNSLEGDLGPAATGTGDQEALGALQVVSTDNNFGFSSSTSNTNITVLKNYVADSGRSGIWIGELNGGTLQDNLVIRWNQHPEFQLFGIPPQFYDQVQADRSVPIVIRYSSNVNESGDITQSGSPISAPVTMTPSNVTLAAAGGAGSFTVQTAVSGFGWKAVSDSPWLMVTSGASGAGSGTVQYAVSSNATAAGRVGAIRISGRLFTVSQAAPFTDDPLVAGTTPIRVVHITELRSRVNALRARFGLNSYSFSDPTLTAGITPVRASHITELRAALQDVYVAANRLPPVYTDPSLPAGTLIRAVHITELRNAIVGVE